MFPYAEPSRMNSVVEFLLATGKRAVGLLLCAAAAVLIAVVSAPRPWRTFVPLAFVCVIMVLAARYGMVVGLFGSIAAAFIFAYLLYEPLGSFRVASQSDRSSLGWMILSGIALPYLLLPSQARRNRTR